MDNKDKIDVKDIHGTFWRCRDFELSNLWQRSVFLTAFLVLCFAAYGVILDKLLDKAESCPVNFWIMLNVLGFMLALLGVIFSILWIKMGKGSKAWYEVYESAIGAVETNKEYSTNEASAIGGFSYTQLPGYRGVRIDNGLFSSMAGEYSVSKLNIAIGQVFLVLWALINFVHTLVIAMALHNDLIFGYLDIFVAVLGILLLYATWRFFGRPKTFRSTSMKWFKKSNN